jgi:hypothetical protein
MLSPCVFSSGRRSTRRACLTLIMAYFRKKINIKIGFLQLLLPPGSE